MDVELSLLVDGIERPVAMRRADLHLKDKSTLVADFPIELGEERATGALELRMDPASDLLTASLAIAAEASTTEHTYALRVALAPEGKAVFIPGNGELGDAANTQARAVVLDDDVHPFALLSTQGPLTVVETEPDTDQRGARPRVVASAKSETVAKHAKGAAPVKPVRLDVSRSSSALRVRRSGEGSTKSRTCPSAK
jgi:hypothetical protein